MIYFISGLGADERVFVNLDIGGLDFKHIKWETPSNKENLTNYCKRLISQIDLNKEIILIGVSFGGIVAQELAKIIKVSKVIIISSVKSVGEFDFALDMVRRLRLHKPVPASLLKWSNKLTGNYYFGLKSKHERHLLQQIIADTDKVFLKWAIGEIMNWKNDIPSKEVFHIHGERDRVFPTRRIRNFIRIKDGGHFMILNKAEEVSRIIKDIISL